MASKSAAVSALLVAIMTASTPYLGAGRRLANSNGVVDRLASPEGPCGRIEAAEARDSDPTQCKCIGSWHYVYCGSEYDPIADRKFDAAVVLAACVAPYCARYADPKRNKLPFPEATTTTEAPTTTLEETTTEAETTTEKTTKLPLDLRMWVEADKLIVATNDQFKCCEYSGGDKSAIVQDLHVAELPKARTFCMERDGCGCMFGDKWHSYTNEKSSGKCRVRLGELASAMKWDPEAIVVALQAN